MRQESAETDDGTIGLLTAANVVLTLVTAAVSVYLHVQGMDRDALTVGIASACVIVALALATALVAIRRSH